MGILLFERFLKQEHSDENLKFWLEVEKMKNIQDSAKRYILIQRIYREFIEPSASNEVYFSSLLIFIKYSVIPITRIAILSPFNLDLSSFVGGGGIAIGLRAFSEHYSLK